MSTETEPPMATRLVEWLEDEIGDTEDDARTAIGDGCGQWSTLGTDDVLYDGDGLCWGVLEQLPRRGKQLGPHIERNDPHAVLLHCAAARKTLELHHPEDSIQDRLHGFCAHCGWRWPCPDVRNLARGYGYQEEK